MKYFFFLESVPHHRLYTFSTPIACLSLRCVFWVTLLRFFTIFFSVHCFQNSALFFSKNKRAIVLVAMAHTHFFLAYNNLLLEEEEEEALKSPKYTTRPIRSIFLLAN